MAWNDDMNNFRASNDTYTSITSNISNRSEDRDAIPESLASISVIGLSTESINNIQAVITTAISNINTVLDNFANNVDTSLAFQGAEITAALNTYLTNVKDYVKGLVSQLEEFNTKLNNVLNAWQSATDAASSSINASSATVTGATYTASAE